MKLLIGIPAYEEGLMIGKVLDSLPKNIAGISKIDILVVDDGSKDNTGQVAKQHKVIVLTHLINRGLGGALKTIFYFARNQNYDILVTFDADGQHDGNDIKQLIVPLVRGEADVVIGSRWITGLRKPLSRYLVNQFANFLTWLLFGIWTTDSQSGLRAFNRKAVNSISTATDGMEVSSEIFREIVRNRLKFVEEPVKTIYSKYSITKGQQIGNAPEVFFQLLLRLLR